MNILYILNIFGHTPKISLSFQLQDSDIDDAILHGEAGMQQ